MAYRINGFDQIKAFYSIVFEQKYDIRPQHISLYVFLINQNNRNNWVEWFKCPFDLAMAGACIGNKKTYYKCLSDLQDWGLIKYEKGINDYKAPKIKIEVLNCTAIDTATVPQSEPLLQPQGTPLHTPQDTHIYKQETIKQETIKLITWRDSFEKYIEDLNIAVNLLLQENDWILEREKFHPNLDIKLSMEKAYKDFWGTESGWLYKKKKSKGLDINWKSTFNSAIELNKVYKQR